MSSPGSSGTMSSSDSQKADQIAFHFYTKLFYVVNQARTTNLQPAKVDKWFNLETPDSELFNKEAREPYRSISLAPPVPLEIQVLLTIPELGHNQVLVHVSPDSSRMRINPTPRFILLETFVLDFIPSHSPADVPLPTIYKHGIPLFRSLFTLLRLLPAWKLHKRLRRRVGGGPALGVTLRVREGDDPDILSLMNSSQVQTHTFPAVPHPMGSLALSATYLSSPTFQLDELESLLSSRFLSLDQRPFTPTLAKNHLRDSLSSSSSSPPTRSPPRPIYPSSSHSSSSGIPLPLPDRQGGAGSFPRQSLSSRPLPRQSLTSIPRQSSLALNPIGHSTSSGAPLPPSGLASTRLQLQQELSTSSSSLSPANSFTTSNPSTGAEQLGLPRRPQPQYPFPFKSNTIVSASSSSSPGTGLPSSLGAAIPAGLSERVGLYDRERERVVSLPQHSGVALSDPTAPPRLSQSRLLSHSRGASLSRGPSLQQRDRSTSRPPGSGAGLDPFIEPSTTTSASTSVGSGTSVPRKRYSSSFGHRYVPSLGGGTAAGAGGGDGSGSSAEDRDRERRTSTTAYGLPQAPHSPLSPAPHSPLLPSPHASPTSSTYLRAHAQLRHPDDDDISMFVQDIDSRKPLVGRARTPLGGEVPPSPPALIQQHSTGSATHVRSPLHPDPHPPSPPRRVLSEADPPRRPPLSPHSPQRPQHPQRAAIGSPPGGLMLTSEAEVDERLRRMNEVFLRSLEGLGNGSSSQSRSRNEAASRTDSAGTGGSSGHNFRAQSRGRNSRDGGSGAGVGVGTGSPSSSEGPTNGAGGGTRRIPVPELPRLFRRQGSEEVIGRMEMEVEESDVDVDGERSRGRRGGRYIF